MTILSCLLPPCSGLVYPKVPFGHQRCHRIGFKGSNVVGIACTKVTSGKIHYFQEDRFRSKYVAYVGRSQPQLSFSNDSREEPFILSRVKEAYWALKSLFEFLIDQPSQLKYIEWPSFQNTLKTAILTLVIVAALIVALSSVDSALCFLLSLFLRRTR